MVPEFLFKESPVREPGDVVVLEESFEPLLGRVREEGSGEVDTSSVGPEFARRAVEDEVDLEQPVFKLGLVKARILERITDLDTATRVGLVVDKDLKDTAQFYGRSRSLTRRVRAFVIVIVFRLLKINGIMSRFRGLRSWDVWRSLWHAH